ncbi:PucR family transcriptional regulator ligand-binding domain-containing protein [Selenihalanaerobacter shriftii]|uniref:Purine catabolism regulatory protein n=1 Tax=Selenihalanaerobacter shriftii TaxID=142842 RepID=A0A1T4JST0_9FIRM|nr:PucR family transcriptional regulator ligand-binding domain-containing protein [Selenihalanaerobacter shriftii]SJZ33262.1 purine catabolism regulatory protein [Selenihalanaerobacter shriftii]
MPKEIGITVREALELNPLKDVKVIAGQQGLDNTIKYINVMEVPDILDWVKEGEFLITTTYSMRDDFKLLSTLIPKLDDSNLAGLGIKPGRYIEEIPEMMVKQADELGFPLLELPYEVSFSEIMETVLSEILNEQASFLKMSFDMHSHLMDVVLDGGGISEITGTLSQLINSPVAIVDPKFKILSFSPCKEEKMNLSDIIPKGDELGSNYLDKELIKKDKLVGRFKRTEIEMNDNDLYQMSIPIMGGRKLRGHIFVWEVNQKLKKVDLMAIERSATVAALEMVNQQAIFEVERKYRNELLYDITSGKFDSRITVMERANSIGWDLNKNYTVILFDLTANQRSINNCQKTFQELKSTVLSELNLYLKNKYPEVILGDRGSNIILLYPVDIDVDKTVEEQQTTLEKLQDQITEFVQELLRITDRLVKQELIVGVGNYYDDIKRLQDSYEEAKSVLKVVNVIKRDSNIVFFDDLGIYRLLYNLESDEIDSFISDTIRSLVEYDQKNNTEFVDTLEQYFICNGNLKKMADNLFLHYNSVLYRVERIQKIMDVDLDDREQRLNLEIGLKLMNFNKEGI